MLDLKTLQTCLTAVRALQVIRMDQYGNLKKSYGPEKAVASVKSDYDQLCMAETELEKSISSANQ